MSEEIIDSLLERAEEMLKRNYSRKIGAEGIITILKEYKKIQKENEELKEDNKKLNDLLMLSDLDYISKGKIREKIEELKENKDFDEDEYVEEFAIDILNELLKG